MVIWKGDIMYSYIKGTVKNISSSTITVENNNIGYLIVSPQPYEYKLEEEVAVYLYHLIRDDQIVLYGFKDQDRLNLFIKLLSVRGIGPKSALSIIAYDKPNDIIVAISAGDVKFLTKFPGIGTKSAQQIILDLKGKLDFDEVLIKNPIVQDVELALLALGYKKAEVSKSLKVVDPNDTVELGIKKALAWLIK